MSFVSAQLTRTTGAPFAGFPTAMHYRRRAGERPCKGRRAETDPDGVAPGHVGGADDHRARAVRARYARGQARVAGRDYPGCVRAEGRDERERSEHGGKREHDYRAPHLYMGGVPACPPAVCVSGDCSPCSLALDPRAPAFDVGVGCCGQYSNP
jgi:hypothetical protein